jgi:cytochrome c
LVGNLEFRLGSPTGKLMAQIPVEGKEKEEKTVNLTATEGIHDIYIVYQEQSGGINIWKRLDVKWIEFGL